MKFLSFFFFLLFSMSLFSCERELPYFQYDVDTLSVIEMNTIAYDSVRVDSVSDIEVEKLFSVKSKANTANQGFAIYDNLLFQCNHSNNLIDVIDVKHKKSLASIILEPDEAIHCNNVNFGPFFYDLEDKYPALYVQQRGYKNIINVYRILSEADSTFTSTQIQSLSFCSCESSVSAIDRDQGLLYIIFSQNRKRYISVFDMPDLFNDSIVIDMKESLHTYYLPSKKVIQDTAAKNGFLYFLGGYGREGELWQIDIRANTARVFDLTKYNLTGEPQGIECYDDGLIISFLGRTYYKIVIH